MEDFLEKARGLLDNVNGVVIGKPDAVRLGCAALLGGGHLLVEDVPGVGKTLLGLALAKSIGGTFRRVQFTADVLPSDITGVSVFKQNTGEFSFMRGPVFCNVLLADEINRATPRTQGSLLEAMEEGRVTVEGSTRKLDEPFFVIATQNPIELEGTYPLPFSQLDRFMARIQLGYMGFEDEVAMVRGQKLARPVDSLSPCMNGDDILFLRKKTWESRVDRDLYEYAVRIIRATREFAGFEHGASPRASMHLVRMAQGFAVLDGRNYVLPDDIKRVVPVTLGHRVIPESRRAGKEKVAAALCELTERIEVPV